MLLATDLELRVGPRLLLEPTSFRIDAPNDVHFHPPSGLRLPARHRMDGVDLVVEMVEHHVWLVGELVDRARLVSEDDLDAPFAGSVEGIDGGTLRWALSRLVGQMEMWNAAVHDTDYDFAVEDHETVTSMRRRLDRVGPEFVDNVSLLAATGRFDETFAAVATNFEEVAATLFPGGEGRLRLVEAGDEDGSESEAGIEVELRPAGKKITRLTLLSGGEKALGAISFLFALFLARPCPFYLLDEVEAALDDTNIARFVELLRRYADRAQFVVVTHQKRTMEAADVLYGVTMGPDGVSQVVSRRLPQHAHAASAA